MSAQESSREVSSSNSSVSSSNFEKPHQNLNTEEIPKLSLVQTSSSTKSFSAIQLRYISLLHTEIKNSKQSNVIDSEILIGIGSNNSNDGEDQIFRTKCSPSSSMNTQSNKPHDEVEFYPTTIHNDKNEDRYFIFVVPTNELLSSQFRVQFMISSLTDNNNNESNTNQNVRGDDILFVRVFPSIETILKNLSTNEKTSNQKFCFDLYPPLFGNFSNNDKKNDEEENSPAKSQQLHEEPLARCHFSIFPHQTFTCSSAESALQQAKTLFIAEHNAISTSKQEEYDFDKKKHERAIRSRLVADRILFDATSPQRDNSDDTNQEVGTTLNIPSQDLTREANENISSAVSKLRKMISRTSSSAQKAKRSYSSPSPSNPKYSNTENRQLQFSVEKKQVRNNQQTSEESDDEDEQLSFPLLLNLHSLCGPVNFFTHQKENANDQEIVVPVEIDICFVKSNENDGHQIEDENNNRNNLIISSEKRKGEIIFASPTLCSDHFYRNHNHDDGGKGSEMISPCYKYRFIAAFVNNEKDVKKNNNKKSQSKFITVDYNKLARSASSCDLQVKIHFLRKEKSEESDDDEEQGEEENCNQHHPLIVTFTQKSFLFELEKKRRRNLSTTMENEISPMTENLQEGQDQHRLQIFSLFSPDNQQNNQKLSFPLLTECQVAVLIPPITPDMQDRLSQLYRKYQQLILEHDSFFEKSTNGYYHEENNYENASTILLSKQRNRLMSASRQRDRQEEGLPNSFLNSSLSRRKRRRGWLEDRSPFEIFEEETLLQQVHDEKLIFGVSATQRFLLKQPNHQILLLVPSTKNKIAVLGNSRLKDENQNESFSVNACCCTLFDHFEEEYKTFFTGRGNDNNNRFRLGCAVATSQDKTSTFIVGGILRLDDADEDNNICCDGDCEENEGQNIFIRKCFETLLTTPDMIKRREQKRKLMMLRLTKQQQLEQTPVIDKIFSNNVEELSFSNQQNQTLRLRKLLQLQNSSTRAAETGKFHKNNNQSENPFVSKKSMLSGSSATPSKKSAVIQHLRENNNNNRNISINNKTANNNNNNENFDYEPRAFAGLSFVSEERNTAGGKVSQLLLSGGIAETGELLDEVVLINRNVIPIHDGHYHNNNHETTATTTCKSSPLIGGGRAGHVQFSLRTLNREKQQNAFYHFNNQKNIVTDRGEAFYHDSYFVHAVVIFGGIVDVEDENEENQEEGESSKMNSSSKKTAGTSTPSASFKKRSATPNRSNSNPANHNKTTKRKIITRRRTDNSTLIRIAEEWKILETGSSKAGTPAPRFGHSCCVLTNSVATTANHQQALIFGGYDFSSESENMFNDSDNLSKTAFSSSVHPVPIEEALWIFDLTLGFWRNISLLPSLSKFVNLCCRNAVPFLTLQVGFTEGMKNDVLMVPTRRCTAGTEVFCVYLYNKDDRRDGGNLFYNNNSISRTPPPLAPSVSSNRVVARTSQHPQNERHYYSASSSIARTPQPTTNHRSPSVVKFRE